VKPGTIVIYLAYPGWGLGVVRRIEPDGRLLVDFEVDGRSYSDDFHAQELEVREVWTASQVAA
jgi:hypothetical protein